MGIKDFAEYLALKKLSVSSMKIYLAYYRRFDQDLEREEELTQSFINKFILNHPSNTTRAFLTNLFDFLELKDFKVPRITGRKEQKKRKSLTKHDIKVLRNWFFYNKPKRYLLCFDLSYYCALRRAEVLGIKIKDFELKEWVEDPTKACKLLIHGKGRRERYVPVSPKIMLRIIEIIEEEDKDLDEELFTFNRTKWQNTFKEAIKNTMDYNFTTHDLRRSRATQWLKNGVDSIRVRNRLGHSSVSTTQKYINLDEEKEFDDWANE